MRRFVLDLKKQRDKNNQIAPPNHPGMSAGMKDPHQIIIIASDHQFGDDSLRLIFLLPLV
jgi:hypothetical protein